MSSCRTRDIPEGWPLSTDTLIEQVPVGGEGWSGNGVSEGYGGLPEGWMISDSGTQI